MKGNNIDSTSRDRVLPTTAAPSNRIDVLDGWRAFSVAMVVFGHLVTKSSLASLLQQPPELAYIAEMFGQFANTGVCIFFALSGYVICRGLTSEFTQNGRISIQAFYVRRAFRILPPLWLFLLTIYVLRAVGFYPGAAGLGRALLFVTNIPTEPMYWITAHTWSLAYEEQFYLFFPALFLLVKRKDHGVVFLWVAAGFVALGALLTICRMWFWTGFGYYFALLIAGASFHGLQARLKPVHLRILSRYHLQLVAMLFALWLQPPAGTSQPVKDGISILKAAVGTPLLVLVVCGSVLISSPITRLFAKPRIASAGRISYGIYLWQQLFVGPYAGAGLGHYVVSVPLVVIVAWISYRFMELPLMAIGNRISARMKNEAKPV